MSRQQVDPAAETLRQGLVSHLQEQMHIRDPRILAAFRAVPRHRFVTHVSIEEAYRDRAIPTKQLDSGVAISSASQPAIMAMMLAIDVRRGSSKVSCWWSAGSMAWARTVAST